MFLLFAHVPQHALVQLLECGHQLLALGFSGIAPDIHLQPQFGAILHGAPANNGWVCRMTGHGKRPYGVTALVADRNVALVAEVFLELFDLGQAVEEGLGLLRGPAAQLLSER